MRQRLKKFLLPLLFLTLGVAVAGLLVATKDRPPAVKTEEQSWIVATQPAVPEAVAPALSLFGRVESPRAAAIAAALAADVAAVPVREGDAVEQGQLLVRLDDRDARLNVAARAAEVEEAEALIASERRRHDSDVAMLRHEEALLRLAEQALARAAQVKARQLISQAAVEEAEQAVARAAVTAADRRAAVADHPARLGQLEARRARAEAELALARLALDHTRITAPFAARIAKVAVAPGGRVGVGATVVELYDTRALELRAQIPAPQVAALRRALAQDRTLPARGQIAGAEVGLVLERLAGRVDDNSGGIDGLFRVVRGAEALVLGDFVELVLELPPVEGVVVLPYAALYGMDRVYVMRDGRMHGVKVEVVGQRRGAAGPQVLVRSTGLRAGDAVITTHLPNAIEGLKVQTAAAP